MKISHKTIGRYSQTLWAFKWCHTTAMFIINWLTTLLGEISITVQITHPDLACQVWRWGTGAWVTWVVPWPDDIPHIVVLIPKLASRGGFRSCHGWVALPEAALLRIKPVAIASTPTIGEGFAWLGPGIKVELGEEGVAWSGLCGLTAIIRFTTQHPGLWLENRVWTGSLHMVTFLIALFHGLKVVPIPTTPPVVEEFTRSRLQVKVVAG